MKMRIKGLIYVSFYSNTMFMDYNRAKGLLQVPFTNPRVKHNFRPYALPPTYEYRIPSRQLTMTYACPL